MRVQGRPPDALGRATGRVWGIAPNPPRVALLGLIAWLCGLGCETRPLHLRDWTEGRTAHFEIISSLDAEETRRLALDLEYFRTATGFVLGRPLPELPSRIRVYAFDGRGFTRPYAVRGGPGSFTTTLGGATIILRTGEAWEGDATPDLRHEYVHYLFRNREGLERPLWYDEGIAQFASTIETSRGGATIGRPRDDFVRLLRDRLGLPAEWVVNRRDRIGMSHRESDLFDAAAWAFVHVLAERFGGGNPARFRKRVQRYFGLVESGRAPADAVEEAFGASIDKLDEQLEAHVREKAFRGVTIRSEEAMRGAEVDLRPLPLSSVLDHLGWLAIDLERAGPARGYFERALDQDQDDPSALAGMCSADRLDGWLEEALPDCERAVQLAPGDRRTWLALGRLLHARAEEAELPAQRRRHATRARESYQRGVELDEGLPDAHALIAATYLIEGEDHALGSAHAERAQSLLPGSLEIALLRAKLSLAQGRSATAHYFAVQVDALSHAPELSDAAREIIRETDR